MEIHYRSTWPFDFVDISARDAARMIATAMLDLAVAEGEPWAIVTGLVGVKHSPLWDSFELLTFEEVKAKLENDGEVLPKFPMPLDSWKDFRRNSRAYYSPELDLWPIYSADAWEPLQGIKAALQWHKVLYEAVCNGKIIARSDKSKIALKPESFNPMLFSSDDGDWTLTKAEVQRFAAGIGLEFVERREAPGDALPQAPGLILWPWGNHDTKLLRDMAAAADAYWKNYDPAETDTAPTNEQVETFLVARGVSKSMAEKMATILRADGLPTGPRK